MAFLNADMRVERLNGELVSACAYGDFELLVIRTNQGIEIVERQYTRDRYSSRVRVSNFNRVWNTSPHGVLRNEVEHTR